MGDLESEEVVAVAVQGQNARKSDKPKGKPKVSFSQEETERLVSLWSEEEVLFNCKHRDYFKTDPRQNAVNRIVLALDKQGLTADEAQKKMSSLRTYYGKEVGKERNSKTSGAGTNQVYTPTWPYFLSMHFLRDNITPRKTVSNLQDQLEVNEDDTDAGSQPGQISAQLTPEKCIFPVENTPGSSKMKKKRSAALEDELLSNCLAELKRPRQHDASDADSIFSHYVCNQLKKIPEGYNKEMLKLEIQQMIVKVMLPSAPARQPLSTIAYNDLQNTLS